MQRRSVKRYWGVTWTRILLVIIVALVGLAIWLLSPSGSSTLHRDKGDLGLRLGLDLKGGTQLLYQVEFPEDMTNPDEQQRQLDASINTIEKRVNKLGVVEPVIQQQGDDRILVQLPGITDIDQAKSLVEETAFLEFREIELNSTTPVTLKDYIDGNRTEFFNPGILGSRVFVAPGGSEPVVLLEMRDGIITYMDKNNNPVDPATLDPTQAGSVYSWMPATGSIDSEVKSLTGAHLTKATPQFITGQGGVSQTIDVGIGLNDEGAAIFDKIASRLYGQASPRNLLGAFLDNELISSATMGVQEYSSGVVITGDFTWDEANTLAIQLTSGALTIKLEKPPLYEDNVSATLGTDFIHRSVIAGVVGLLIVMLFMIFYYRGLGLIACAALLIYAVLVLAIYKWIPVTLTLAGIGAFVISLGMAVDANVLIFERVKEELRAGRTIGAAIEAGFSRAWSAIRDSNITTFIACGVLYWFSSRIVENSQVKGFALTLVIGVAVSMFTAITVSHILLRISATSQTARRLLLPKPEKKEDTKI